MLLSRLKLSWLIPLAMVTIPLLFAQSPIPRFSSVEPMIGKPGTEIVVTGENLGKENVADVFFTDGTNDIKVKMDVQTATSIKCKIPAGVKVGIRYRLMLLTRGEEPKLIEQPVRVEIEE